MNKKLENAMYWAAIYKRWEAAGTKVLSGYEISSVALLEEIERLKTELDLRATATVGGIEMFVGRMGRGTLDTSDTLLKCPFCGHDGAFNDRGRVGHDHYTVAASCSNTSCGVHTPEHYQSREAAAKAWNRRV